MTSACLGPVAEGKYRVKALIQHSQLRLVALPVRGSCATWPVLSKVLTGGGSSFQTDDTRVIECPVGKAAGARCASRRCAICSTARACVWACFDLFLHPGLGVAPLRNPRLLWSPCSAIAFEASFVAASLMPWFQCGEQSELWARLSQGTAGLGDIWIGVDCWLL